ncbi:hypothetical protein TNCV_638911 [Trichonephila clavipes]|nr:hypothetical protein TNCV_638911 [Trichonephila clavipes]
MYSRSERYIVMEGDYFENRDSRSIASKRLDQLWRRLDRDPKLYNLYTKFIEEYLSLDHMEEIANIDDITSEEGFFSLIMVFLEQGSALVP